MVLGSWNPEFTVCPFQARTWPFQAPKTLRFKGKMLVGVPAGRGVPGSKGVGVPARGVLRPVRVQEAWEYHESPQRAGTPCIYPKVRRAVKITLTQSAGRNVAITVPARKITDRLKLFGQLIW